MFKKLKQKKMSIKCIEVRKEHYLLIINDISLGEFEKSDLRHIIEVIDGNI